MSETSTNAAATYIAVPVTQPAEPSTDAGKALLNSWKQDAEYEDDNADFIVEIERQACAATEGQIAALRSALERLLSDDVNVSHGSIENADRVLSDTASAATEYEARIRAEAVAQERARVKALIDSDPIYRSLDLRAIRALSDGEREVTR